MNSIVQEKVWSLVNKSPGCFGKKVNDNVRENNSNLT
jgi:hypothetical protein